MMKPCDENRGAFSLLYTLCPQPLRFNDAMVTTHHVLFIMKTSGSLIFKFMKSIRVPF